MSFDRHVTAAPIAAERTATWAIGLMLGVFGTWVSTLISWLPSTTDDDKREVLGELLSNILPETFAILIMFAVFVIILVSLAKLYKTSGGTDDLMLRVMTGFVILLLVLSAYGISSTFFVLWGYYVGSQELMEGPFCQSLIATGVVAVLILARTCLTIDPRESVAAWRKKERPEAAE